MLEVLFCANAEGNPPRVGNPLMFPCKTLVQVRHESVAGKEYRQCRPCARGRLQLYRIGIPWLKSDEDGPRCSAIQKPPPFPFFPFERSCGWSSRTPLSMRDSRGWAFAPLGPKSVCSQD